MCDNATGHDATDTTALDIAQAAAQLGISPGAVRKRIERGQLRGSKVSGRWEVVLGDALHRREGGTRDGAAAGGEGGRERELLLEDGDVVAESGARGAGVLCQGGAREAESHNRNQGLRR